MFFFLLSPFQQEANYGMNSLHEHELTPLSLDRGVAGAPQEKGRGGGGEDKNYAGSS